MADIKYIDLRKGMVFVGEDTQLYLCLDRDLNTPGNWRAILQLKIKNLKTGSIVEKRFRPEDKVDLAFLDRRNMTYSYRDGSDFYFTDTETFEQESLSEALIGKENVLLLRENDLCQVIFYEGKALSIELPATVTMKVVETEPTIKGATAAAQFKKATMETGLIIDVPSFVNIGELIDIDTREIKYLKRLEGMMITLTTDFGLSSPYVAAMKGVLLGLNPAAQLLDLTHTIPPQNVRHAAYFLANCVPYFPVGTLHVVVVDPGVGTNRALLYAEVAGQQFLAPDNGVLTDVIAVLGRPTSVRRLTNSHLWRPNPSATFHGRDILAPVAAHLSLGLAPAALGESFPLWQELPRTQPTATADGWAGEVVFVDDFGNLLTNLPFAANAAQIWLNGQPLTCAIVPTYGKTAPGTLVALSASNGCWEIAVVNGSATQRLNVGVGALVQIRNS